MARQRNPLTGELMIEGITAVVSPRTGAVTYRARLTFADGGGTRRFRSATKKTYDQALEWKRDTELRIRRGTYAHETPPRVAEVWDRYRARKARTWSSTTAARVDRDWSRHLAPEIGALRIDRITRADLQRLIDQLEAKVHERGSRTGQRRLSPYSIRVMMVTLGGMFHFAHREGIIPVDPATHLELPASRRPPRPIWTSLQMQRFLAGTRDDHAYPLWRFLASTGCRVGEAMALRVEDVRNVAPESTDPPTVWLHRTYRSAGNVVTYDEGTKTSSRGRILPIEPSLQEVLIPLVSGRQALDFVFVAPDGRPWTQGTLRHYLDRAIAQAGLPRITPHGFRHSVATMLIANRVPHNIVASILGHASIQTTLSIYAHVGPDEQRLATSTLATLIGGDSGATTSAGRKAE